VSYSDVLPYFRTYIAAAGPFTEVDKPFDQSIPSSIIDRSYSLEVERVSGINRNMIDFSSTVSIFVNLYRKGYISESKARENALIDSELIIKSCMKIVNSNTQPSIKNVKMRTVDINPVPNNDNTVVARINFDVYIIIDPNL
jgi:hypothetical protein